MAEHNRPNRAREAPNLEAPLTRDAIVAQLHNADDRLVLDLIATGASVRDFTAALAWVSDNDAALRAGVSPPTGRAGELVDLLRAAEETETPGALDEP